MNEASVSPTLALSSRVGPLETRIVSGLFAFMAVAVSALVIYGAYLGGITALLLRSTFFSGVAAAGLAAAALQLRWPGWRLLCYLLALIALSTVFYATQVR